MKRIHLLTQNINHYLGVLARVYRHEGAAQKLTIIVNAQVRTVDEWSYDNWDGGTYGHALHLLLPENLYLDVFRKRDALQSEIANDINELNDISKEFIGAVFLEMQKKGDRDWRVESGVLLNTRRVIPVETSQRIWGEGYRVFLSHKVNVKKEVSTLKRALRAFGITGFVAHEDVEPTRAWQDEIESALSTMNAFVALLTPDFHESLWTDQEVGFALGRNVPIIAVKLGKDPYGFIAKFQALSCNWTVAPFELTKLLVQYPPMLDAYIDAIRYCESYEQGNHLARLLPYINVLSSDQGKNLLTSFNSNEELRGSFGFNGLGAPRYGHGLPGFLKEKLGWSLTQNESKHLVLIDER